MSAPTPDSERRGHFRDVVWDIADSYIADPVVRAEMVRDLLDAAAEVLPGQCVNRALLEAHMEQAMDNAARNPGAWRSMLGFVVDGCADTLDAALLDLPQLTPPAGGAS